MGDPGAILIGLRALQLGYIDATKFADACAAMGRGEAASMGQLLEQRGWISASVRMELEREGAADATGIATVVLEPGAHGNGNGNGHAAISGEFMAETVATNSAVDVGGPDEATVAYDSKLNQRSPKPADPGETTVRGFEDGMTIDAPSPERLALIGDPGTNNRDRYNLSRLHAKGGIGQVWLAQDPILNRQVALKELRPEAATDPVIRSRFLAEAKVTGQLEHPGIVPVYELAGPTADGRIYYTMRFVRGRTMHDAAADYHAKRVKGEADGLEQARLLQSFVAICQAVAYAHSRGVLHRDLKGRNIVLGDFGEAIVLDWGLVKFVGQDEPERETDAEPSETGSFDAVSSVPPLDPGSIVDQTRDGQALGTPGFMSPEQAAGKLSEIDQRSDVYGLGAVLYEILTGQAPFHDTTVQAVIKKVLFEPPVPPREVCPEIKPALEAVCLKALSKSKEDRYASAGELAEDVLRHLADEPVTAYPEPLKDRVVRWAKKHRTLVASSAALLVTGFVASTIGYALVRKERDATLVMFDVARTAVNDMYTGVAEDWLADNLDGKQREFLEKALHYYEDFARRDPTSSLALMDVARSQMRVGDIQRKLGKPTEARKAYSEAMTLLSKLVVEAPADPAYRSQLAVVRSKAGALIASTGDTAEAEPLLRQGSEDLKTLRESTPTSVGLKLDSARSDRALAEFFQTQGRFEEAEQIYSQAVATLDPVVVDEKSPTQVARNASRELALALDGRAITWQERGRKEEAARDLEKAVALLEPYVAADPKNPGIREVLAKSAYTAALLARQQGNAEEAARWSDLSRQNYERLVADFPDRVEYQRAMARAEVERANRSMATAELDTARRGYERAIERNEALLAKVPDDLKVRRDLARAWGNLGVAAELGGDQATSARAYERALGLNRELEALNPDAPEAQESIGSVLINRGRSRKKLGDLAGAEEDLGEAARLFDQLSQKFADKPLYSVNLAKAIDLLGSAMADAGRVEDAAGAYRRVIGIYEGLVGRGAPTPAYQEGLAAGLTNLAATRLAGSEEAARRAVASYEKMLSERPDVPSLKFGKAAALDNLGALLTEEGKLPEADTTLSESVALLRGAATPSSEVALATALADLARVRIAQARPSEALDALNESITLQRSIVGREPNGRSRSELARQLALQARAMVDSGRYDQATQLAVEATNQAPGSPEPRLDAARVFARCLAKVEKDGDLPTGDRERLARNSVERALAQIRVAADSGSLDVKRLSGDQELSSLEARPEFRQLLAELGGVGPAEASE